MPARRSRAATAAPVSTAGWTIDDVAYDPATHTSALPDGRKVPHVTEVLGATGVADDFAELRAISDYLGERVELAGARGRAVHADCHAYDDDDLVWETVDPRVLPYVEAWAQCRMDLNLTPVAHARERRVYHPLFCYTGILDGVFERALASGAVRRILLDLKTGDPDSAAAHLQTAAYEQAWVRTFPHLPIDERWAVQLTPKTRVPYRVRDYTSRPAAPQDFGKFLACMTVYHEQVGRRSRV